MANRARGSMFVSSKFVEVDYKTCALCLDSIISPTESGCNGLGEGGRGRKRCEPRIQMETKWKKFFDNVISYTRWKHVEVPFASLSTICLCAATYLENP